jgi:hypothetical protein
MLNQVGNETGIGTVTETVMDVIGIGSQGLEVLMIETEIGSVWIPLCHFEGLV